MWYKQAYALGLVDAAKVELAVERARAGAGLVEDADGVARDRALREEVVRHGRDEGAARDGALGEVDGPDSEDAVDALEALRGRRDADALALDHEFGAERHPIGVCRRRWGVHVR